MTATHEKHSFYAGDTWEINGTLYDVNNARLVLDGIVLQWTLLNLDGVAVIPGTTGVTIEVVDNMQGRIRVIVDPLVTITVPPGHYTDALRMIAASRRAVLWDGQIVVNANPIPEPP